MVIPAFNDTRYDKAVNQKLSTDFDIATTQSDSATEITAVLNFPKGLYYIIDDIAKEYPNFKATFVVNGSTPTCTWL